RVYICWSCPARITKASTCPSRIAARVSSASRRRRRNAWRAGLRARRAVGRCAMEPSPLGTSTRPQIESYQDLLLIRHVTDQAPKGRRQTFDQCRRGDNLIAAGEREVPVDIDDFQLIVAGEMLVADTAHVLECPHRSARRAGHVEPKDIAPGGGSPARSLRDGTGLHSWLGSVRSRRRRSRPTRTRSASDRSPMIFFTGGGR